MTERKFEKKKVEKAMLAVEDMCLHCKEHTDECPIMQITKELKKLL